MVVEGVFCVLEFNCFSISFIVQSVMLHLR
nr:MAG TPA: hypothetical protein [Caudoviricetes sp.]